MKNYIPLYPPSIPKKSIYYLKKCVDENYVSTGGKLIKPPEGGKLTVYKPKPVDPITKIKLNYPKRGVHTGSSWVTRGYAKQFGAVNAIGSGITKYKQERAKGRSRLASATAGTLKGGT